MLLQRLGSLRPAKVIAVCLLVKLIFFGWLAHYHPNSYYSSDTGSYVAPIADMLQYGSFSVERKPELFRTPGYSAFLLPSVYLLGMRGLYYCIILQLGAGAVTAWLLHRLILSVSQNRLAANLGMLLILIDPAMWIAEFTLLTETLFTLLLVCGIWLLVRYTQSRAKYELLAGVVVIGLSAYVRPVSLYLGYLLCAILMVGMVAKRKFRDLPWILTAFLLNYGILQVWVHRNQVLFGVRIFSSVQGCNLYTYNAACIQARVTHLRFEDLHKQFQHDIVSSNPAMQAKYQEQKGLEIISRHPLACMEIELKGLLMNMFDPALGLLTNMLELRKSESGIIFKFHDLSPRAFVKHLLAHEKALLLFTLLGGIWIASFWLAVARGLRNDAWAHAWLGQLLILATSLYLLVLASGPGSMCRMRVPAVPFLSVYAAFGICALLKHRLAAAQACAGAGSKNVD